MRKAPFVLAALLAVAGICVMLWPVFTGHRLQANTDEAVQSFLEERKPEQQYPELLAALREDNQRIHAEKQSGLVDLEACETPAADLVAYGIEDDIISEQHSRKAGNHQGKRDHTQGGALAVVSLYPLRQGHTAARRPRRRQEYGGCATHRAFCAAKVRRLGRVGQRSGK